MFEEPKLLSSGDGYSIRTNSAQAEKLVQDLQSAVFEAELTDETLGCEDLNSDTAREEVRTIKLSSTADELTLQKFLRGWKA